MRSSLDSSAVAFKKSFNPSGVAGLISHLKGPVSYPKPLSGAATGGTPPKASAGGPTGGPPPPPPLPGPGPPPPPGAPPPSADDPPGTTEGTETDAATVPVMVPGAAVRVPDILVVLLRLRGLTGRDAFLTDA